MAAGRIGRRLQNIFAWNAHFSPYDIFSRAEGVFFGIFAEKAIFYEKTLDSAHNFLYNKLRNNNGHCVPIRIGVKEYHDEISVDYQGCQRHQHDQCGR